DRWQSARDLKVELEWIVLESREVSATSGVNRQRLLPWMIAAAVLAIVAFGFAFGYYRATRPAEPKPLVRFDVDLGPDVSLGSRAGSGPDVILSPDGTRLVYVSKGKLFTRKLDQPRAIEMADTEGAYAPFFSPDGQWVAFFVGVDPAKLKRISADGGASVVLYEGRIIPSGGSWGEDGNIISACDGGGLSRIPSTGGAPSPVTERVQGEWFQGWPQILPGGKAVLFTSVTGNDGASIQVVSLKDRRRK